MINGEAYRPQAELFDYIDKKISPISNKKLNNYRLIMSLDNDNDITSECEIEIN